MNTRVALAVMVGSLVVGVSAADLHKTLQGVWVVDEKARLEASPLWQLSTPAKKKELEKQTMAMPATKFEFKAATWGFAPGPATTPYKVAKRGANSLVLETTVEGVGKDEITVEYISDTSLKLTLKSAGIPLIVKREK